jgi:hypothetical protein
MKKIIISIVIFLFLIGLLSLIQNISYVEVRIKEGDFHGLEIGMEADEVYEIIPAILGDLDGDNIYFISQKYEQRSSYLNNYDLDVLTQIRFLPDEYDVLKDSEKWDIYLDGDYRRKLEISFNKDGRVEEVYYYYQRFELP